jgi:formate hydrogenlyase subunit 4
MFAPWGVATKLTPATLGIAAIALVSKLAALGIVVALLETHIVKLRLFRIPELLALSFVLALLAVTSSFLLG